MFFGFRAPKTRLDPDFLAGRLLSGILAPLVRNDYSGISPCSPPLFKSRNFFFTPPSRSLLFFAGNAVGFFLRSLFYAFGEISQNE